MAVSQFDKKILDILTKNEILSPERKEEVLELLKKSNQTVDEILIDNEYVDEESYIGCIASAVNLPPINLKKVFPDKNFREEIPEEILQYHNVFPISRVGNILTVAVGNPFDIINLDDFKIVVGCEIQKVISTVPAIKKAIYDYYHSEEIELQKFMEGVGDEEAIEVKKQEDETIDLSELTEKSGENEIVDLVNKIILNAVRRGASDIHFEPFENIIRVRIRIDGSLEETTTPPKRYERYIASRLKIMTDEMDISERRKPQDGRFQLLIDKRLVDFRVSSLPTVHGEKVVLRILDRANLKTGLAELGFEKEIMDGVAWAISQPHGMILVTGPTGSGKSTTLYSCIQEVKDVTENITTVEEPVEYEIDGINQVDVKPKQGLTFPAALRSILRQDPDTILLGEIRDQETIEIAIKAALTGHRVFSTLHTNDAPSTITRIIDMGIEPFLVSSTVLIILAQRLGKRLCEACKRPVKERDVKKLIEFGFTEAEATDTSYEIFEAVGCEKCHGKGFKGRFAITELLKLDDEIREMIVKGRSTIEIKNRAIEKGMLTLRRCGIRAIMQGKTTLEEVKKVTRDN